MSPTATLSAPSLPAGRLEQGAHLRHLGVGQHRQSRARARLRPGGSPPPRTGAATARRTRTSRHRRRCTRGRLDGRRGAPCPTVGPRTRGSTPARARNLLHGEVPRAAEDRDPGRDDVQPALVARLPDLVELGPGLERELEQAATLVGIRARRDRTAPRRRGRRASPLRLRHLEAAPRRARRCVDHSGSRPGTRNVTSSAGVSHSKAGPRPVPAHRVRHGPPAIGASRTSSGWPRHASGQSAQERRPGRSSARRRPGAGGRRRGTRRRRRSASRVRPRVRAPAASRTRRRSRTPSRRHTATVSASKPQSSSAATTAAPGLRAWPAQQHLGPRHAVRPCDASDGQLDAASPGRAGGAQPRATSLGVGQTARGSNVGRVLPRGQHHPQRRAVRDRMEEGNLEARAAIRRAPGNGPVSAPTGRDRHLHRCGHGPRPPRRRTQP